MRQRNYPLALEAGWGDYNQATRLKLPGIKS